MTALSRLLPNKKIIVVMTVIVLVGLVAALVTKNNNHQTEPTITYSTNTPDESKEKAESYKWRGSPVEPKKIIIDKINVDAFIQKSGIDQNSKIAVPNNVHLASWFSDSVKPGQKGLSIISGHVSGQQTDGIFKQLASLQPDDNFVVELGNGEQKRFRVTKSITVKEQQSAEHLFSQDPRISRQLNIITCGGEYDNATNQYTDRTIISGELI